MAVVAPPDVLWVEDRFFRQMRKITQVHRRNLSPRLLALRCTFGDAHVTLSRSAAVTGQHTKGYGDGTVGSSAGFVRSRVSGGICSPCLAHSFGTTSYGMRRPCAGASVRVNCNFSNANGPSSPEQSPGEVEQAESMEPKVQGSNKEGSSSDDSSSFNSLAGVSKVVGSRFSSMSSSGSELLQDVLQHDRKPRALFLAVLAPILLVAATALASFLASQPRGYRATVRLPNAYGVTVGTPVRVRGSDVGVVVAVNPSLKAVDALMEIKDEHSVIPRKSTYTANQSGLVKEPLIDITPELPILQHVHSPKDVEACRREGKIVCDGDVVDGSTGICVDELVGLWVRMGRLSEQERARRYGQ